MGNVDKKHKRALQYKPVNKQLQNKMIQDKIKVNLYIYTSAFEINNFSLYLTLVNCRCKYM